MELSGEQKMHAWLGGDTQSVSGLPWRKQARGCAGEWVGFVM